MSAPVLASRDRRGGWATPNYCSACHRNHPGACGCPCHLPAPVYVITVTGSGRLHRAEVALLRLAVYVLPPAAASLALGPSWAVALVVFAVMVLTVGVENSGAEEGP